MKKTVIAMLVASMFMGGCQTVNPTTGKIETSVGQTAAAGAVAGGVLGALIGGKKGALIGAALGGGAGYLYGLDSQRKELEQAKLAAAEIQKDANYSYLKPVVYTQGFQDVKSGEKAEGLKSIDMKLPVAQMTNSKGELNDKGKAAMVKLQQVADRTGTLEIIVPRGMKATTFVAMSQAAPKAKITVADGKEVTARIHGKPVDPNSNVRLVSA